MSTRFYLPSTGTAPVAVTPSTAWAVTTGFDARPTSTVKTNTASATGTARTKDAVLLSRRLDRQYVSPPLSVAQTISGTFSAVLRGQESTTSHNAWLDLVLRVVSGDGTVERGVLYAGSAATAESATVGNEAQEFGTGSTRIKNGLAVTPVAALVGDRLVIEIGYKANSTSTTATVSLRYGDATAEADYALTAGLTTFLTPWVELSHTVAVLQSGTAAASLGGLAATATGSSNRVISAPAAVSSAFLATIARAHRAVVRVRVLERHQTGLSPSGTQIPIIGGDVKMSATTDIKATVDLSVPGAWWAAVQPYGRELFIERGVVLPNGSMELVALGYYRIDRAEQDNAPHGAVRLAGSDRIAQIMQNRVIRPWQIPDGMTHLDVFESLINGRTNVAYAAFPQLRLPISFTGYEPLSARVYGGQVVEDSCYEFLAKLADTRDCTLRITEAGALVVEPRDADPAVTAVWTVSSGPGGNLISVPRRSVARERVYNVVAAYGTAPDAPTLYQIASNEDPASLLRRGGLFGPALRFYSSPLLRTDTAAAAAAQTVLSRYQALPESLALTTVVNPALRPVNKINVRIGQITGTYVVDQVTIPLVGSQPMSIDTRGIGAVPPNEAQRPGPGSGAAPVMPGTVTAYDPATGVGTVDVGGVSYPNMPIGGAGCCAYDVGDPVLVGGYGGFGVDDVQPYVLGPVATATSSDPATGGSGAGGVSVFRNLAANPKLDNNDAGWELGARVACPTDPTTNHLFLPAGAKSLADLWTDAAWAYQISAPPRPVGAANSVAGTQPAPNLKCPSFPVTPGRSYYALAYAFSAEGVPGAFVRTHQVENAWYEWLDAGGAVIGTSASNVEQGFDGSFIVLRPLNTLAWPAGATAPAGAVRGRPVAALFAARDLGTTLVFVTKLLVEDLTGGSPNVRYFDGDTTPADFTGTAAADVAFTCTWDGTRGDSTSVYHPPEG